MIRIIFISIFFPLILFSQTNVHLVNDINKNQTDYLIRGLANYNNQIFFRANSLGFGEELWKSDGTENGTSIVKDIIAGSDGSSPHSLVVANGYLYFVADGKIWKSDGTSSGTNVASYQSPNSPELFPVGNNIFFIDGNESVGYYELYKYSTLENTTTLVKDINLGPNSSYPSGLTNIDGLLYFSSNDGINGFEIWKTDGTETGTNMVKNINPGSASSLDPNQNAVSFIKVGLTIFFIAKDAANGYELWKTDGTEANTLLVKNLYAGDTKGFMGIGYNNLLYFIPINPTNSNWELWKSDGTSQGTTQVDPGPLYHNNLNVLNNEIIYSKYNELWKTNEISKTLLKNNLQSYSGGIIFNNKFYFTGESKLTSEGLELWQSDGTQSGTEIFKNIATGKFQYDLQSSSPTNYTLGNNQLFFIANDALHGYELWKSDGTSLNTNMVKDIYQNGNNSSSPSKFLALGDKFSFNATVHHNITNPLDDDIFISDDSTGSFIRKIFETTFPVLNIFSDDKTTFFTHNLISYKINSTFAGVDVLPFSLVNTYNSKTVLNNETYFTAHNFDLSNIRVYKMDNLGNSTPVHNNHYNASNIINFQNFLIFDAFSKTGSYGRELWRTDGTTNGTYMVKDINPGGNDGIDYYSQKIVFNGILYFEGNNGINGKELWRSDGTANGTYLLKDIHIGSVSSSIKNFVIFNNKLYFLVSQDGFNNKELWETDGTSLGTIFISNFNNSWTNFDNIPPKIEIANNLMFFSVGGSIYYYLWKSDGTSNGTMKVLDSQNNDIKINNDFIGEGEYLYFGGLFPSSLSGLSKTNGLGNGTSLINSVNPKNFFKFKNKVFFSGSSGNLGYELWSFDLPDCQVDRSLIAPTNNISSNSVKYEVSNNITAYNKISGSANVIYDAAKNIVLLAGFEVSNGATFKAQIDGCGNN